MRKCPQKLKELAYLSLVESNLDQQCGTPHYKKDINAIDKIQRHATRFVKNDYSRESSVMEMIEEQGWKDLGDKREARLLML